MNIEEIVESSERNLSRVVNLVSIYRNQLGGTGSGRKPVHSTDLLRAAVVFLHASLEDFLRDIARIRLPDSDEQTLNQIPLSGIDGRAEKFFLGRLTRFRRNKVKYVIEKSVSDYLDKFTVNNIPELESLLSKLNIEVTDREDYFPQIANMMERRHHIVHQADKNTGTGSGVHRAKSINPSQVEEWHSAVKQIINNVSGFIENDG